MRGSSTRKPVNEIKATKLINKIAMSPKCSSFAPRHIYEIDEHELDPLLLTEFRDRLLRAHDRADTRSKGTSYSFVLILVDDL